MADRVDVPALLRGAAGNAESEALGYDARADRFSPRSETARAHRYRAADARARAAYLDRLADAAEALRDQQAQEEREQEERPFSYEPGAGVAAAERAALALLRGEVAP